MRRVLLRREWQTAGERFPAGVYDVPDEMPLDIAATAVREGVAVKITIAMDVEFRRWEDAADWEQVILAAPEHRLIH